MWIELLVLLALVAVLVRILHLACPAEKPKLYYKDPCSPFIQNLLKTCPFLTSVYTPTQLWGKSGHFQTIVHARMGRVKPRWPDGRRIYMKMDDGANVSYDLFDPHHQGCKERAKFTLAICPGIANSSECIYLRTFSAYAQTHGYRIAVLNHLGTLKSETLTSPRIFTYGNTEEYGLMIDDLREAFPDSHIIAVGFSMGANIVTKYLGEDPQHQAKVLCGMSICQGYDALEAKDYFMQWAHLRRLYTFFMTINIRRLLARHRRLLFSEEVKVKHSRINEKAVFSATSLVAVDEHYSSIRAGHTNAYEYYKWSSCSSFMQNITIPMLYMNAEDDPLVPSPLFKYPRQHAEQCDNCIFLTTKHGGHLGYFEGGFLVPRNVTYLDRIIVEYADAIISMYTNNKLPAHPDHVCTVGKASTKHGGDGRVAEENRTESTVCVCTPDGFCAIRRKSELNLIGYDGTGEENSDLRRRVTGKGDSVEEEKKVIKDDDLSREGEEKKGSLKRGSILKKATSYVQ